MLPFVSEDKRWEKIIQTPKVLNRYVDKGFIVIRGRKGSGRSTALKIIAMRARKGGKFVLNWQLNEGDTFENLAVALISSLVRDFEARADESRATLLALFESDAREVLFALVTRYLYLGNFVPARLWFRRFFGIHDTTAFETNYNYYIQYAPLYVIESVLNFVTLLGYTGIVVLADDLTLVGVRQFETLLEENGLYDRNGFQLCVAIRDDLFNYLRDLSRVTVIRMTWTLEELWTITDRILDVVIDHPIDVPPIVRHHLNVIITEEMELTPRTSYKIAELLYWLYQHHNTIPPDLWQVLSRLYQRYIPIVYQKETRIVWRGEKQLGRLKEAWVAAFERFYAQPGVIIAREELEVIAGSADNLHTLIYRLRKFIEPTLKDGKGKRRSVYFDNKFGEGFSFDNCNFD